MLDVKYIREHVGELKQNIKNRGLDPEKISVDRLLEMDERRLSLLQKAEALRKERNKISQKMGGKLSEEERRELVKNGREIKVELKKVETERQVAEREFQNLMDWMPNITSPKMPVGKDESGNVEIKVWGGKPKFDFKARDHLELGKTLDLVDVGKSAKVAGSRFWYIKNELVLMEFGLIQYALGKIVKEGFTPILSPALVKEQAMYGTGFFPSEKENSYRVKDEYIEDREALYLVGTAEVPMVSYHVDDVFEEKDLPKKYFGVGQSYRTEVGSWGKDVRGLKRVHQFNNLEMIVFAKPTKSEEMLEYLRGIGEEVLQDLELPYHIINMCTGDVGLPTYKKYDFEVWLPSQQEYCEVMSHSNIWDYQARRLNIRYKRSDGKLGFVHTLNATFLAMPRIYACILDNYQQEDGSVKVPKILQECTGKKVLKPES